MNRLHDYANTKELIRKISQKLNVSSGYTLVGLILLGLIILFSCRTILILASGFLYPAYMTCKALKGNDSELLKRYGKYWVMLSLCLIANKMLGFLMEPFSLLNLGAILLLLRSDASLATTLYDSLAVHLMENFEPQIDSAINSVKEKIKEKEEEIGELKSKLERRLNQKVAKDKTS